MKRTVLGLVAVAALAAPATAAASTIEHSVSTVSFESSYENRSERFERWVSADRARQVITNTATGALRYEAAEEPLKFTAFDATRNEVATLTRRERQPLARNVRPLAAVAGQRHPGDARQGLDHQDG